MNPAQHDAIAQFAKTQKISKEKLMAFAKALLEDQPKVGRAPEVETLKLRNVIRQLRGNVSESFTAKQLAERVSASPANVTNALTYLQKHEGICRLVGKQDGHKGKGRIPSVWKFL